MFFFQAEVGIRDVAVTGVQTCALPIYDDYDVDDDDDDDDDGGDDDDYDDDDNDDDDDDDYDDDGYALLVLRMSIVTTMMILMLPSLLLDLCTVWLYQKLCGKVYLNMW